MSRTSRGDRAPPSFTDSMCFNREQLVACQQGTSGRTPDARTAFAAPPLRVLVVDDDHDTADSLTWLIREWGYEACGTYDGASGVKAALIQRPHVALLDMKMSVMTGFEVARQLRLDRRQACFLIAISGFADAHHRPRAAEAGLDLYLVKPVDPDVVFALLRLESERVAGLRQASQEANR